MSVRLDLFKSFFFPSPMGRPETSEALAHSSYSQHMGMSSLCPVVTDLMEKGIRNSRRKNEQFFIIMLDSNENLTF